MRKNDLVTVDYSQPMKQSYVAIILIIYKYYKILFKRLWPLLIIFFAKNNLGENFTNTIMIVVVGFSILSMALAILDYHRYFFFIENDELHVRKGIFKKKRISIPLERVQTINFEENIVHRIFSVTSLKIDTAGSAQKEFDLDAIDLEDAQQIRDFILSRKKASSVKNVRSMDHTSLEKNEFAHAEPESLIMRLNMVDLIKIGISYNHFRSAAWIVAGFFWITSQLEDLKLFPSDLDVGATLDDVFKSGLVIIGFLVLFFFVVSFIVSLVRTVIANYDLRFIRKGSGFKIVSGLITRKEYAALDNKIQMISWKDNLLQKHLFGIFDFKLKQAGSVAINSKKAISVPGLDKAHIADILTNHLPSLELSEIQATSVHPRLLKRKLIYFGLIAIPLLIFLLYFKIYQSFFIVLAFSIYLVVVMFKNYHKTKYAVGQEVVLINGGTFGDEYTILKDYKIQAIKIKRNWYQRRHQLASLKISTASGTTEIPYITYDKALAICDFLLYKVEKSTQSWM